MNTQLNFNIDDKTNKRLQYYKDACRKLDCEDIEEMNDVETITFCMVRCKFGIINDYHKRQS